MKKIRVGGAILILLTLLSLLFMGRGEIDSSLRSAPPTLSHILGCDTLGRDLLERIGGGVVVSLSISIFTSLLSVFFLKSNSGLSSFFVLVSGFFLLFGIFSLLNLGVGVQEVHLDLVGKRVLLLFVVENNIVLDWLNN